MDTDADVAGNDKLFAAVQAAHDFNFGTETAMVFDEPNDKGTT